MRIHLIIVRPQMRYVAAFIILSACSACNPFYSVEQSDVERGYRWIGRGDYSSAPRFPWTHNWGILPFQ